MSLAASIAAGDLARVGAGDYSQADRAMLIPGVEVIGLDLVGEGHDLIFSAFMQLRFVVHTPSRLNLGQH